MRNVARQEHVGCRPAFDTCIAVLEKKFSLDNVEGLVLPVVHMERRSAFRLGNPLEDHQTSRGLPACNDGSYQIAEDVQGGIRPGLAAQREHKLPQRFRARSCHRSNLPVIVYECNDQSDQSTNLMAPSFLGASSTCDKAMLHQSSVPIEIY